MEPTYNDLLNFHGHKCPGLTIGYRMAMAALAFLGVSRAQDEELVAIVENSACGVDALQCLTGCTCGKGNLIFKDYGKQAFTLYNRNTKKAVRATFKFTDIPEDIRADRNRFIDWLLGAREDQIVDLKEVVIDEPERAKIVNSVVCEFCSEMVMQTRTQMVNGKTACIPCARKHQQDQGN